jgi:hypothetical protein
MRQMLLHWKKDYRITGERDSWNASQEEKMRCRSAFLATNMATARREEKRQFRKRRSIRKRAELLDAIQQDQENKEESVSEEEQTARARAKAEGRAKARRSNTKDVPSSVIEKRVPERAKLEDILRNVCCISHCSAIHLVPSTSAELMGP